jgi:hypothetical protein
MKLSLDLSLAFPEIAEFYNVGFCGCPVGRVWLARDRAQTAQSWDWLISLPMTLPESSKGAAASLGDAMGALAAELARLIAATPVGRLQRAFDFAVDLERRTGPSPATGVAVNPSLGAKLADLHAELAQSRGHQPPAVERAPAATVATVREATSREALAPAEEPVSAAMPEDTAPPAPPKAPSPAAGTAPSAPVRKSIKLNVSPPVRPAPGAQKPVKVITQEPAVVIQPAQAASKLANAVSSPPIVAPTPAVKAPVSAAGAPNTSAKPVRQPLSLSGSLNLKMSPAKSVVLAAGAPLPAPAKSNAATAAAATPENKPTEIAKDTLPQQATATSVPPQMPSVAAPAPAAATGRMVKPVVVAPRKQGPAPSASPQILSGPTHPPARVNAMAPAASASKPGPVALAIRALQGVSPTKPAGPPTVNAPAAATSVEPLMAPPPRQEPAASASQQTSSAGGNMPAADKAKLPAVIASRGAAQSSAAEQEPGSADVTDGFFASSDNRAMLKDIETLLARHA